MITTLVSNTYKAASKAKKNAAPAVKSLPVTYCMRLKVHDHHILFTPFVWEKPAEVTEAIPARVEGEEWETLIPAKPFIDWLRASQLTPQEKRTGTSEQITFTFEPKIQTVYIRAGNTRASFKCIDSQEFPC